MKGKVTFEIGPQVKVVSQPVKVAATMTSRNDGVKEVKKMNKRSLSEMRRGIWKMREREREWKKLHFGRREVMGVLVQAELPLVDYEC